MFRVRQQIGCREEIIGGLQGRGVTAALLDTGIFPHPDFGNRILGFYDFVNERKEPYDDSGHGTHVAGCLAGDGRLSGGKYKGVAPAVQLVIGKVLNDQGEGDMETMLTGIRWVLSHYMQYRIRILNVSIGLGEEGNKKRIRPLVKALEEAWELGILVVAAAGNSGPGAGTLSPLGESRKVLTVGCHDGNYRGTGVALCETYSGRGVAGEAYRKPDIVAPGTNIISTCSDCRRRGRRYENAYIAKSGTSMAAPVVAGAAALLWEAWPYLTNVELKQRLLYAAEDMREPWNKQGWGMLNVERCFR